MITAGVEQSSFLTLEVLPEFCRDKSRDREGRVRETQKRETKWIKIKDTRKEWKRETSKLLRENCVWHRREEKRRLKGLKKNSGYYYLSKS